MKRRILMTGFIIVLLLLLLAPGSALAAKPASLYATGTISRISPGNVAPAGESGRWRVIEREVNGTLAGDLSGEFTLTYQAVVELQNQAGNFSGTLQAGTSVLRVNGQIQPLEIVAVAPGLYLPKLTINGHWTAVTGPGGQGNFDGWVIFVPTPEGHVGYIVASSFAIASGQ